MAADISSVGLDERALRHRLGIPDDAEQVIVFAESSHWDPDWLYTSEAYYDRFVRRNLDQAVTALLREPRRVYSIECMFFLRMYWDRHPEQHETLRLLLNARRLRLTGSGVTTADTLIPGTEAILRDFLIGQEWLRANGIVQEPRLAYFTDSFGCSASLPTLLRAAGFDRTALTRVDGMYFMGCDFESAKNFPRPGSTAEYLKQLQTLDFIWRDANGAEVLCHWNAFTYGQGDMLAYRGLSRVYIVPLAWPDRSEPFVARRIAQFVTQLGPLRRTPYMFCPLGTDFVPPLPDLVALLDRYNRVRYPSTGVWAVNAGLDDYLALVECYRDRLPVVQIDPNPYWTGFYTARPALKKRCRDLVDRLGLAEGLTLLPQNREIAAQFQADLADAWWIAATSNHHDFVTGTSPDAVVEQEQLPWLNRAMQTAQTVIQRLSPPSEETAPAPADRCPAYRQDERLVIQTPYYALELDEHAGGCIVRAWQPERGHPLLGGLSNGLIGYRDSGGLWRMGCEFRGGRFAAEFRTDGYATHCQVDCDEGMLRVNCNAMIAGEQVRRLLWFDRTSPLIRGCVEGRAPDGMTITLFWTTGLSVTHITMGEPGGVAVRPLRRFYEPTFWPAQDFVYLYDEAAGCGLAVLLPLPSAVSCTAEGILELVALRNANRERAFGFLPIPANPATGHEREPCAFHYALLFTPGGDWRANKLPLLADRFHRELAHRHGLGAPLQALNAAVHVDPPTAILSAFKAATRGQGIIVRLIDKVAVGQPMALSLPGRPIRQAFLCDARERDITPLPVQDGQVRWVPTQPITTLRLITL